jgi:pyruvoyl-dependent arginine decarboxylase (PvlArgDC)
MLPTVYETMQSNAPGEVLCAGIGIGCPENESSPAAGVIFSHSENCSREEMIKMLRSMVDEGMDQMRMIKHYRFEYAISATVVDSNTPTAVFAAVCFCDSDLEQMFLL